jgi:hypothetical protein
MQDNNFKEDLFGKGVPSGKSPRVPAFNGYVKQQRYLPYLKMPTEYAVILAISVIVLFTLSYAWGVKVGRSSATSSEVLEIEIEGDRLLEEPDPAPECQERQDIEVEDYIDQEDENTDIIGSQLRGDAKEVEERVEREEPLAEKTNLREIEEPVSSGRYVIYLAAFKDQSRAEVLSLDLKDSGVDARVDKKSDWYQVYAAGYATITEADSAKTVLSKDFPDCYIRKLE